MSLEFDIVENPSANSELWATWKHLVEVEGWTSDDRSVTLLTPSLKSTRSVFAVKPSDKSFIGTVVWNEYDNICFLGFFLLAPEYRGKGCGMRIWKKALSQMPNNYVLGLRGVPSMVEKYKSMSTPIVGANLINYEMQSETYKNMFKNQPIAASSTFKSVRNLTETEWQKLINYDKEITGRNREEFLTKYYHSLDFTQGLVLFENEKVVAHISSVQTSRDEDITLKIAPLYADSEQFAFEILKVFSEFIFEKYEKYMVIFHVLETGKGQFMKTFFDNLKFKPSISGVTLYSSECPKFGDLSRVFIAHNNSCHYDY